MEKPLWLVASGAAFLLTVDLLFLAANLTKIAHGAWLPLLIGVTAFTILTTWQRGREIVTARREQRRGIPARVRRWASRPQPPVQRVPGTAVFLNRSKQTAPLAMRATRRSPARTARARRDPVDRDRPVPHVPPAERLAIDDLG